MGWDSFGLPAEQHAIATGVHPRITTEQAIDRFRAQLMRFGFSYDWQRELATTNRDYYKWTQWIFLKIFNSWFDPTAAGEDERRRPHVGKARPIESLRQELAAGRWRVDAELNIVAAASAARSSGRSWTELSPAEQRQVIDQQRLAYLDEVPVNWCPMLGTVLANEEVTSEGRSERGDHPVYRKPLKQWMLRITRYCERLIDDIDTVEWPEAIKSMQRNWVGRSAGAEVDFPLARPVPGLSPHVRVFTTRPDTLYGATYMVLAPEHPLAAALIPAGQAQGQAVREYIAAARSRSELERTTANREKTGVFSGGYAINPVNGREIPIWIADYVLTGYGTGAIMAVPAHDDRDFEFARRFSLPVVPVVRPPDEWLAAHARLEAGPVRTPAAVLADTEDRFYSRCVDAAYTGDGTAINSGEFDGLPSDTFKQRITSWLQSRGLGRAAVHYKLRDWLFSRQRYWGEPFPLLHGPDGEIVALGEDELPVDLPHMEDFKPDASEDPNAPPRPPLGKAREWSVVQRSGRAYARELNTMPQWAGSCWYYLRFVDPHNPRRPWNPDAERYWLNVDQYVGGAEHAVLHLLYARFWHKVLFDLGEVSTVEPFQRLFNQGLILSHAYRDRRGMTLGVDRVEQRAEKFYDRQTGEEVQQIVAKMSKALKNVVNPDDILDEFGADTFRLYEMYMGPLDAAKPWNTRDIPGLSRFLNRVWRLAVDEVSAGLSPALQDVEPDPPLQRLLHQLIRKVTDDIEAFKFNTAIAEMISFTNEMTSRPVRPRSVLKTFILLLSPLAPHIAEELWQRLGHERSLSREPWPAYDPDLARDVQVEIPVQVNGKVRARIAIAAGAADDAIRQAALADPAVQKAIAGHHVSKVIVKPSIVNVVVS
jgi:leucyl-tRNA synthetase